jgi:hypothetical protein
MEAGIIARCEVKVNGSPIASHSSPTDTLKSHIYSELKGTAALDKIAKIQFCSAGVVKDETTTFSGDLPQPNRLRLYGTYTPSSSYTLNEIRIVTQNGYTYFTTSLAQPVNVTAGVPVSFEWSVTLDVSRSSTSGFLTGYNLDMTSYLCRLLPAILQIIAAGRSNAFPSGINLRPTECKVMGSDTATIIAQTTSILMTADDVNRRVTYDTGYMQVTQVSAANEYIAQIWLRDPTSGCGLVLWTYTVAENVKKGDLIRVTLTIQV